MTAFVHDWPARRVVFGAGTVRQVGEEAASLGARFVMVASPSAARVADRMTHTIEAVVARIDDPVRHVPADMAARAVRTAVDAQADAIVAVGGGSAIGLAKAVAKETRMPVLAVPTTYSGSEMTSVWGITTGGVKTTGRDSAVRPRIVVYDPELTVSLPTGLSAASIMNALAHCVEGAYAADASPLAVLVAAEAAAVLAGAAPRVAVEPSDLDARSKALYGAWLAGWVLDITSTGIHHRICHVIGGSLNLPHAETHSAVLPYSAAYNASFAPEALARIATALGSDDAAAGLWELAGQIGAPRSLAGLGMRREQIAAIAEAVSASDLSNPRPVDRASVEELLRAAFSGERP